jgi:membrane protease YdiL (CAAX protease family)
VVLISCYLFILGLTFLFRPLLTLNTSILYRIFIQIIIYLALVTVVFLAFRLANNTNLTFYLKPINLRFQLLVSLIIAVILLSLVIGIPLIIGINIHDIIGDSSSNPTLIIIILLLIVAPSEELVFRGYYYQAIKEMSNPILAGILSSILFGLWHLVNGNIFQVLLTTIIGFIFSLSLILNKKTNIWSTIIAHGVYGSMLVVFSIIL